MIEKHIVLEDIDPVVFYGVGNAHLQMLKALFPKLRIVARDNVIRVIGDEEQLSVFEEKVDTMLKHVLHYNSISEENIIDIVKGNKALMVLSFTAFPDVLSKRALLTNKDWLMHTRQKI